jgi:hypothetical protein
MTSSRSLTSEHACFGVDPIYGLSEQVRKDRSVRIKWPKVLLLSSLAVSALIGYELETNGGPTTSFRGSLLFFFTAVGFLLIIAAGIQDSRKKRLRRSRLTHD